MTQEHIAFTRLSSVLPYPGGKSKVADFLVSLFPPHELYVDMFCGGLSVSLAKPPSMSKAEWFNDKYDALVNFFYVMANHPDEFLAYFEGHFVIDAETMYRRYVARLKEPIEIPDVEAAVVLWMTQRQTFTGRNVVAGTSYRYANTRFSGRHVDTLDIDAIRAFHARLAGVQIFCRDFRHIFRMLGNYDNPTTFIFQDPPYWDVRGGDDYAEKFTYQDHEDLANLNLATRARWLMTINDHPDIRSLYEGREGIHIREYDITYGSGNRYDTAVRYTHELLISNYNTETQFGPLFTLEGDHEKAKGD